MTAAPWCRGATPALTALLRATVPGAHAAALAAAWAGPPLALAATLGGGKTGRAHWWDRGTPLWYARAALAALHAAAPPDGPAAYTDLALGVALAARAAELHAGPPAGPAHWAWAKTVYDALRP